MINELLYIIWEPNEVALHLGPLSIRWYSLCWLIGLAGAYFVVKILYKEQGIENKKFEPLFLYCFIGILIGARLGHCCFYEPGYYLTSAKGLIEMIIPIKLADGAAFSNLFSGNWKFIGYEGLASHGGTFGLILALWIYCKNWKMPKLMVIDFIAIATPITACFIRLGNLMNSEIVGKVTQVPWAFIFAKDINDPTNPRHPAQLYESLAYALLFFIGWIIYRKKPQLINTGFFFGFCLAYIFTFRFFIEFFKANQEVFENSMPINMGQILSLPFAAVGIFFIWRGLTKPSQKEGC